MSNVQILGFTSISLALFLPISILICFMLQKIWCWIDDSEYEYNKLSHFIKTKIFGLKRVDDLYDSDYRLDCGSDAIGVSLCVLLVSPTIIYLSIKFYSISLFILTCIAIVHIARFVRRLGKKFNLHCNDNNIHK